MNDNSSRIIKVKKQVKNPDEMDFYPSDSEEINYDINEYKKNKEKNDKWFQNKNNTLNNNKNYNENDIDPTSFIDDKENELANQSDSFNTKLIYRKDQIYKLEKLLNLNLHKKDEKR